MPLVLDAEQNFTCRSCGECCRRAFDIVVTEGEKQRYETENVARWFRETPLAEPGATRSPFEKAGGGLLRIRKRGDGVCGFLSGDKRCRIHEELGGAAKPLTCQMFPFSFDLVAGETRVSTSFCCPTVVKNEGLPIADQERELAPLARRWRREGLPLDKAMEWVRGRTIDPTLVESIRWVFRRLLDLHEPSFSLRRNIRRIAALVEDWTRQRVLKLDPDRFEEYVKLTGEFAVTKPSDPPPMRPAIARFLFRGFFFSSIVPLLSRASQRSLAPLRLRLRLVRVLLHIHGVGPVEGLHFGRGLRGVVDIDTEPFFTPAYHVLRAAIENLGTGRRPVVEELSLAVGHLLVAETLFLSRDTGEGALPAWIRAIMDSHDVAHTDPGSLFGRILVTLAAPPNSLHLFGARVATSSV